MGLDWILVYIIYYTLRGCTVLYLDYWTNILLFGYRILCNLLFKINIVVDSLTLNSSNVFCSNQGSTNIIFSRWFCPVVSGIFLHVRPSCLPSHKHLFCLFFFGWWHIFFIYFGPWLSTTDFSAVHYMFFLNHDVLSIFFSLIIAYYLAINVRTF